MKKFSMAFAMTAALLAFAVGCDDKNEVEPAVGLKMSIYPAEFEFNDRHETGEVKVTVEDAAEWSYSVPANSAWIGVERIDGGVRITVEPIEPDAEDNVKSRTGSVDIKAVRGVYSRVMTVEVKQYADDKIPADGPIHFHDATFGRMMIALYDTDENGKVSPTEALKATVIDCHGRGIASLGGIGYFRNLTSLDCNGNALSSLDLRKNTKIKTLDVRSNPLTELVLGYNQNIADLQIDDDSVIVRR